MFAVMFERKDCQPNEIYFYHTREDAAYHFSLFCNDDSGLYSKISIFLVDEDEEILYNGLNIDAVR